MTSRPRVSLEEQIAALQRRLLRLNKEARRTALLDLMSGLRFFPIPYGPKRPRAASKRTTCKADGGRHVMTNDYDTALLTWFFAVGYCLAQRELAEELRAVQGRLDKLISELEIRVGQAIEEVREGRSFARPSGSGTVQ